MCCGLFASCAVSVCSTLACNVCCNFGRHQSVGTRLCYAFLLLLTFLLSVAMLGSNTQHWINENIAAKLWFDDQALATDDLVGTLAVTRLMSASVFFHVLLLPLVVGVQNTQSSRAAVQNGMWPIKMLLWVGLIVMNFFLPNALFTALSATVYRAGGFLFIMYQLTQLVDFAFEFYRKVYVDRGDQDAEGGPWLCLALLVTLLAYGWTIFVTVMSVVVHRRTDAGCGEGVAAAFIGQLLCVGVSVLSVTPFVRGAKNTPDAHTNGIFQASVVSAYCSYLVISAMLNHPDLRCRPVQTDDVDVAMRMIGVLFTFISVSYFAVKERYADVHYAGAGDGAGGAPGQTGGVVKDGADGPEDEGGGGLEDDETDAVKYTYWLFHFIMAGAAMYLTMLLTGWNTIEGTVDELILDRSLASVWIKVVSSWLCYALYAMALVLPPCCPDRVFGKDADVAGVGRP